MKKRLYIFSDTILQRKQNTLFVQNIINEKQEDQKIDEIIETKEEFYIGDDVIIPSGENKIVPIESIDSIFIIGTVKLNSRFFSFLSKYKIPVHFCSTDDNYAGSFLPSERLFSGSILIQQSGQFKNNAQRLFIAKEFVLGAVTNTLANLRYYHNRGSSLKETIEYINDIKYEIEKSNSISELMGFEGIIKKNYYQAWRNIFYYPVNFHKRIKNPPNNMINSLISYGNAIVYGVCLNEIYQTRLNPEIGFLHEPADSKLSLVYDIAEIFKPLLTDRIIFKVINKNILSEKDFVTKNGFCKMKKNTKKIYAQEFENKLYSKFYFDEMQRNISYRRLIREECYNLLKHIKGEKIYNSYKTKW